MKYSILSREVIIGPITPSRGIQQGDLMSPYLFILVVEGLIALFKKKERRGLLHGCQVSRSAPSISYILFADDAFLFFRASAKEYGVVKYLLEIYHNALGQEVSLPKSSIMYSSNVSPEV